MYFLDNYILSDKLAIKILTIVSFILEKHIILIIIIGLID